MLALAQAARQIDDGVALKLRQGLQQLLGQRPRTGAELPQLIGAGRFQRLCQLAGQGLAKPRRQLGCGDKITAATLDAGRHQAKFARIVGVITPARRVQGHFHETVKAHPAAGGGNGLAQV